MIKFTSEAMLLRDEMAFPTANHSIHTIEADTSSQLADRLNSRLGNQYCRHHPGFINEIRIDLTNDSRPFWVIAYCCEEFLVKLRQVDETSKHSLSAQK